ncbi:hypothetical protein POM88_007393 [Heracleum sosnowskyi]|uniref:Protein kinase domain-containing protein n=1 Tax=Heracleum sosnowskyi TaxID=360622 RepID=A0AAD8N0V4_9APIA|nr:hypothetical protein POM88_007393 [Heracleum sosnowskyi]
MWVPGVTDLGLIPRSIKKVAILGGGSMGSGIATTLIVSNYPVILIEVDENSLQAGIGRVKGEVNLSIILIVFRPVSRNGEWIVLIFPTNLQSRVEKGEMTRDKFESTISLLKGSLDYETFRDVYMVIEAVTTNVLLKQKNICGPLKILPATLHPCYKMPPGETRDVVPAEELSSLQEQEKPMDGDYEPKITDFGLARLMNPVDTHLSTFVNGEFGDLGYVAPEYARTLVATPKGDIYNFGLVLLELVTGERSTYIAKAPERFKGSLVEWLTELSRDSKLQDAIDKPLLGKGYDGELFQFLKVACNCVIPGPKGRPTMFEVYQLLRAIGQRYNFTTEDDIMLLLDTGGDADMVELIVSREVKGKH